MSGKRAIPPVLRGGDLTAAVEALKLNLEIIMGQRAGKLGALAPVGERWRDLLAEITTRTTGAGTPAYNVFRTPTRAYQFVLNDEVYTQLHIPHDWRFGTPLYVHVHWAGDNTNTGTVTWDMNWTYAKGYGQQAFPAASLVQVTQAHCGIAYGHNIAEMSDAQAILPDGCETDGILMVATKLSAKAYTGNVFAFFIDLHYQSDGTDTTTRNPNNGSWFKSPSTTDNDTMDKINELIDRLQ